MSGFSWWRQQRSTEQLSEAICVYGKAETIKTCWQLWAKLRASCSVIYVKSWRTISSSWFFKEAHSVTCFWQFSIFAPAKGIWVQWILGCAVGLVNRARENKHTLCHQGKMGTAAAFSGLHLTPCLTTRQACALYLHPTCWVCVSIRRTKTPFQYLPWDMLVGLGTHRWQECLGWQGCVERTLPSATWACV